MGLIDPEEISDLFLDLEADNGTLTIQEYVAQQWRPLAGWANIPASIVTDPDRDDVDYIARVPANRVPAGLVTVTAAMRVMINSPRMQPGPYAIRLIDDMGGVGLIWQIDLYKVAQR